MQPEPPANPIPLNYALLTSGRRRCWLPLAILLIVLVSALIITALQPSQNRGGSSPRLRSASNLRQIGQGCLLYSNDNHGEYPDSLQRMFLAEDFTANVFVAPASSDEPATGPTTQAVADQLLAGGHLSYIYLGRGMNFNTTTPNTVVAYERMSFDSTGGINVLFGDGHVGFVPANLAAPMLAKVAAGVRPVELKLP